MNNTLAITISGVAGSGKSALAALIVETLREHGYSNVVLADEFPHVFQGLQNEPPYRDYLITVNTLQRRQHHG